MVPFFSLCGVSKYYSSGWRNKKTFAVNGLDLQIERGEAVGFIGHNGAGKSTTIRLMLGLQSPTSGVVSIRGVAAKNPDSRRGVAYLPEKPLLYEHLTASELMEMSLRLHGWAGDVARQRDLWLDRFGILNVAKQRVFGFSKGMAQRLALAMALCPEPQALVLDEPLSGLDPIGRKDVVDVLEEYRRNGNTLFFSSHVLSDVERLADRYVFIHRGGIRASHSVDSVLRAASDSYELVIYSELPVAGYQPVGRSLWLKRVTTEELVDAVNEIRKVRALLHSVKSASNLEQLYLKLVGASEGASNQ